MKKTKLLLLSLLAFLCFIANSQTTSRTWQSKDIYQLDQSVRTNSSISVGTATITNTVSIKSLDVDSVVINLQRLKTDIRQIYAFMNPASSTFGNGVFSDNLGRNVFNHYSTGKSIVDINYLIKQSSDTVNQTGRLIDYHLVSPNTGVGTGEYSEYIYTATSSLDTKITNGSNVAASSIPVVLATDITPTVNSQAIQTASTIVYSSSLAPVASASLILAIAPATTSKLDRITISGIQTTGGNVIFKLMTLTSAPTGGSYTNPYGYNLEDGAAVSNTSDVKFFTANPTGGGALPTGTGLMSVVSTPIPAATATTDSEYTFDFTTNKNAKQPVVSSSRIIALVVNDGVTITGGNLFITVQLSR